MLCVCVVTSGARFFVSSTASAPPYSSHLPTRRVSGRPVVEVAHMELARCVCVRVRKVESFLSLLFVSNPPFPNSPSLADAVAACKAAGAVRVIVAPYFLSHGRHVDADIPSLAAAAAAECDLPVTVAAPLGVDAALAGVIEARVAAALDEV